MYWELPPRLKIYEALGALGDKRVALQGNRAVVESSTRSKAYEVAYEPSDNSITSNDNASYWVGYLGYPAVAFLIARGLVSADERIPVWLSNIPWKELNTQYHNDYRQTETHIRTLMRNRRGLELAIPDRTIESIEAQLADLKLVKRGRPKRPPVGY